MYAADTFVVRECIGVLEVASCATCVRLLGPKERYCSCEARSTHLVIFGGPLSF